MQAKQVVFTFDDMIASLRSAMKNFPDLRRGKNTQYAVLDAACGAFSVFFIQCPSFLQYQKLMQQRYGLSNAQTLFGMQKIPSDNHIRNLLDGVSPEHLASVYEDCFTALQTSGHLAVFRVGLGKNNNDLLLAFDGTTYFSSNDINCLNCSTKGKEEQIQYAHGMVTPTIVAPGVNKVISLVPEFVVPQDGDSKQDCEIKASKRWMNTNGVKYSSLEVTILGDDLYAHEPWCRDILKKGYNFIFTCKPDSHKTIYEWVKGIATEVVEDRFDGKTHQTYTYSFVEGVPMRDSIKKDDKALIVNFLEVTVAERKTGKKLYHNAFISNHALTGKTEQETKRILGTIVDCGRARWKIENENNNTLKRQGYHLEHNFGHGKKYLASMLASMNILAFLFHTMLEFMNTKYKLLRTAMGARKTFFNDLRTLMKLIYCQSFDSLMDFMIEALKQPHELETLKFPV